MQRKLCNDCRPEDIFVIKNKDIFCVCKGKCIKIIGEMSIPDRDYLSDLIFSGGGVTFMDVHINFVI